MTERLVYTVRGADTLWGIARDYLGDPNKYRDIRDWNNLTGLAVQPGQRLKLYNPVENGEELCAPVIVDTDEDNEPTVYE